jgi:CheY-like chemotaxis protein
LARLGYTAAVRRNVWEALEAFRAQRQKFDLVVTDLTMPKMTGIDLVREIRAMRGDIPVILCTGFAEAAAPEMAQSLGIREILMKPIVIRDPAEAIQRVFKG